MDTEIQTTNQNTGVANFEKIETAITEVVTAIKATEFNVMNPKGLNQAIEVRAQIKALRINLGKAGKSAKAALTIEKRRVDTEVARLTDLALTGEEPLHKLIKDRQDVLAEEKRKRDEAERERKAKIQNTIQAISGLPAQCHGKTSEELKGAIDYLNAYEITGFFAEFTEQALHAQTKAMQEIQGMIILRVQQDNEDAERAAEAERLAEQKRIQDERQAVLDAEQAEINRKKAEQEEADRKKSEEEAASIEDAKQEGAAGTTEQTTAESATPDDDGDVISKDCKIGAPGPGSELKFDHEPITIVEESEWVPVVRRLKKDVLSDILGLAQSESITNYVALDRIVEVCHANLKPSK